MPNRMIVFGVLLLSLALGQQVEKTIFLPDALGGMQSPFGIAYDSVHNRVYVGGRRGNCVIAIDAATDERIARIPAGISISTLLHVPRHNKLYCANGGELDTWEWDSTVTVIDCVTNTALATLHTGQCPAALCYNSVNDRIYVANTGGAPKTDSTVTVIDCAADTVVAAVKVGVQPIALCYNPQDNKVYAASYDWSQVTVIDGATNQVVKTISAGAQPRALCYNPANNKVYVACYGSDEVAVINGANDSVLANVGVGDAPRSLCVDSRDNKLYCANYWAGSVTVLDAAADTVIVESLPVSRRARAVAYHAGENKVYCTTYDDDVGVIDCATDSLVALVATGANYTWNLCVNLQENKVYSPDWAGTTVPVLDGAADTLIATVVMGQVAGAIAVDSRGDRYFTVGSASISVHDIATDSVLSTTLLDRRTSVVCHASPANKLYLSNYYDSSVTVYDCVGESVSAVVPVGRGPQDLCCSPVSNRVYCLNCTDSTVSAIDVATSQVRATLPVGSFAMCYAPDIDRVYCANPGSSGGDGLIVIDCAGDSVMATIPLDRAPSVLCYIPGRNALYCACTGGALVAIDCAANQVLDTVMVGSVSQLCYNPHDSKAYTSYSQTLTVIDAVTDSVIVTHQVEGSAGKLCYVPEQNHVYCAGGIAHVVHVLDGTTNEIVATVPVEVSAVSLYLVEQTSRVYVTGPARYTVIRTDLAPGVGEKTLVRPDASRPVLAVTPSLMRRAALVRLCLPVPGMARVTLHDVAGRVVRDLFRGELTRGVHDFRWDGNDNAGRRASPGVYLLRAETASGTVSCKALVVR